MRVGITGSTGMIGTALAARLVAAGHEVAPLTRTSAPKPQAQGWNPAAGWIAPGMFEGCDAVVHLAGASIGEGRWTKARKRVLWDSRIDGTRLLVDHLGTLARPPRVLVSSSASGYYGNRGDLVLSEDAGAGEGFLPDLVQAWEGEARHAEQHGIRVVTPRLGVVLAREGGALPRMVLPVRLGAGGPLGNGRQWMPWVTLTDAVRAFEFALTHEVSGAYNVAAPEASRNRDFMRALGRQLRRPSFFPTPAFLLRIVIGEAADGLLLASARMDPARFVQAGFTYEHPSLAEALQAVFSGEQEAFLRRTA
ncbi:MAG: TIGR01777 family oxidoreductase [Dehalococcoidia bacterium]|nr:TIGR01777 family oxidoreductase [Dehalococcoidia bacterium]